MPISMPNAVQAPPGLPVTLQVSRIRRRIAVSDHVAAVLAGLAFGERDESWRRTVEPSSKGSVTYV